LRRQRYSFDERVGETPSTSASSTNSFDECVVDERVVNMTRSTSAASKLVRAPQRDQHVVDETHSMSPSSTGLDECAVDQTR
jgi:hypothetical protein